MVATRPESGVSVNLYCPNCGYDLRGSDVDAKILRCPECGVESERKNLLFERQETLDSAAWFLPQLLFMPILFSCIFPVTLFAAYAYQLDSAWWIIPCLSPIIAACLGYGYFLAGRFMAIQRARGQLIKAPWIVQSFPACWALFSLVEIALTALYVGGCIFVMNQG